MPNDRLLLRGKRVLVTGGTTGIGRAIVALLAQDGARIFTFGRDEAALKTTLGMTEGQPGQVLGTTADVASKEDVARVYAEVDEALGGLDILISCAAIGSGPLDKSTDAEWRYVVETNLVGAIACSRAAIDRMIPNGGGQLIFIGSISAEIKAPGESVYSPTKAGIQAFAETLRKELAAQNIRVSVIQPGSTKSEMQERSAAEQEEAVARHEFLQAEDVADAVYFVATRSERCNIVNLRIEPRLQQLPTS
jgi:3-hydroxy acid dehydrogenase/malonic semialdehyde reductase